MRLILFCLFFSSQLSSVSNAGELDWIVVSKDGKSFEQQASGKPFVPWGLNYDRDTSGRLIEDYWSTEWATIESDFAEMKELGANVVRIHLQFGKFMKSPTEPNQPALDRLGKLIVLAEQTELYLDLTGLGCYHRQDVPDWYDQMGEVERWQAQAEFWKAVAKVGSTSRAIFCYNLMNEPVLPGDKKPADDWLGPAFAGKHYVQFLVLEMKGRSRMDVFQNWTGQMLAAIRQHDKRHLVTVGMVPWILDRPDENYGYINEESTTQLDFLALHLYPESGNNEKATETLKDFRALGKPVVIEETFPLHCTAEELGKFIEQSEADAAGWIGFYWGEYPENPTTRGDKLTKEWLELFQALQP
ncbi:Cellulase (glycosyl hydrolase family 5) [Polystyrenella longa]|uniref:mannan endo-1,4-beta-mannosidase n=1 Tax=Polystyrenella longa TaxID=2528007 RepID=A0A518CJH1_9PLAN|nr:cellulase family glycosylhydrolase [Polystyrenella longa]QDU79334.1 Cellulase (glycosyl hydrolase family 5) [Polystyrenella longa]